MIEIARFKGSRAYIHATDELLTAESLFVNADKFTFTARRVGTCVARWVRADDDAYNDWEVIAKIVVDSKINGRQIFECKQDPARPITSSMEFDEAALSQHAIIDGEVLTCHLSGNFTLWEYLVSLHKLLLQRLFEYPQWYFARLEFDVRGGGMAVKSGEVALNYSHQKGPLYISKILVNNETIGEIAFSKR
jgi:hypothetical protein